MEKKRKSFLKRYQFLILVFVMGGAFFSGIHRWDLFVSPARDLGKELYAFLGMELKSSMLGQKPEQEPQEVALAETKDQQGSVEQTDAKARKEMSKKSKAVKDQVPSAEGNGENGSNTENTTNEEIVSNADDATNVENPANAENTPQDGAGTNPGEPAAPSEPTFITVDETYFDDALFIGDSRVVGLRDYGKLGGHGTFYANEGLNIYRLMSSRYVEVPGQRKKISVDEALQQNQFAKIYIMVGINELDIGTTERYQEAYRETIARIQELQPDARIIIMSIMLVTKRRDARGDFVSNAAIMERNEAIAQLADGEKVFYLDVNEAIVDETGYMNAEYSSDGIHLKAKYVPLWTEFLKTHVIQ